MAIRKKAWVTPRVNALSLTDLMAELFPDSKTGLASGGPQPSQLTENLSQSEMVP